MDVSTAELAINSQGHTRGDTEMQPPQAKRTLPSFDIDIESFMNDRLKGLEETLLNMRKKEAEAEALRSSQGSHPVSAPSKSSLPTIAPQTQPQPSSKDQAKKTVSVDHLPTPKGSQPAHAPSSSPLSKPTPQTEPQPSSKDQAKMDVSVDHLPTPNGTRPAPAPSSSPTTISSPPKREETTPRGGRKNDSSPNPPRAPQGSRLSSAPSMASSSKTSPRRQEAAPSKGVRNKDVSPDSSRNSKDSRSANPPASRRSREPAAQKRTLELPRPLDSIYCQNYKWAKFEPNTEVKNGTTDPRPATILGMLTKRYRGTMKLTWFAPSTQKHGGSVVEVMTSPGHGNFPAPNLEAVLELTYSRHDKPSREFRVLSALSRDHKTIRETCAILAIGDVIFATRLTGVYIFQEDLFRESRLLISLPYEVMMSTLDDLKSLNSEVTTDYSLHVQRQQLFEGLAKDFAPEDVLDLWSPARSRLNSIGNNLRSSVTGSSTSAPQTGRDGVRTSRDIPINASSPIHRSPSSPSTSGRTMDASIESFLTSPNTDGLGLSTGINPQSSQPSLQSSLQPSQSPQPSLSVPLAAPSADLWGILLNFNTTADTKFIRSIVHFLLRRFVYAKHEADIKAGVAKLVDTAAILKLHSIFCIHPVITSHAMTERIVDLEGGSVRMGFEVIRYKVLTGCDKSIVPRLMDMLTEGIPRCPNWPELARVIFEPYFVAHLPKLAQWALKMPSLEDMSGISHSLARATSFAYTTIPTLNPHECGLASFIDSMRQAQAAFGVSQQLELILARLIVYAQAPVPTPFPIIPVPTNLAALPQIMAPQASPTTNSDTNPPTATHDGSAIAFEITPSTMTQHLNGGAMGESMRAMASDPRLEGFSAPLPAVDPRMHPTGPAVDPRAYHIPAQPAAAAPAPVAVQTNTAVSSPAPTALPLATVAPIASPTHYVAFDPRIDATPEPLW